MIKPTLIIYAANDTMFATSIISDLDKVCKGNNKLKLLSTKYGGHVHYLNSKKGQKLSSNSDIGWTCNRVLDWF